MFGSCYLDCPLFKDSPRHLRRSLAGRNHSGQVDQGRLLPARDFHWIRTLHFRAECWRCSIREPTLVQIRTGNSATALNLFQWLRSGHPLYLLNRLQYQLRSNCQLSQPLECYQLPMLLKPLKLGPLDLRSKRHWAAICHLDASRLCPQLENRPTTRRRLRLYRQRALCSKLSRLRWVWLRRFLLSTRLCSEQRILQWSVRRWSCLNLIRSQGSKSSPDKNFATWLVRQRTTEGIRLIRAHCLRRQGWNLFHPTLFRNSLRTTRSKSCNPSDKESQNLAHSQSMTHLQQWLNLYW